MSLRLKLSLMLSAFLFLIAIFAFGTLLIFEELTTNSSVLNSVSRQFRVIADLESKVRDFADVTTRWGLTGDIRFKKEYPGKLADVYRSFEDVDRLLKRREELETIEKEFKQVVGYSNLAIASRHPVGSPDVFGYLQQTNLGAKEIINEVEKLYDYPISTVMDVSLKGEQVKREMIYYLFALIVFSSLTALFLIVRIRKTIAEPFKELLRATARIGEGDLSYRVQMNRRDEFGTLSDRFNSMVADLESSNRKVNQKLSETELFLEVARIAGSAGDLKGALTLIASTIASKLRYDGCEIYMLRAEKQLFYLEASNTREEEIGTAYLSPEEGMAREVLSSLKPFVIKDTELYQGADTRIFGPYGSVLSVPIMRDGACSGILVVKRRSSHIFSEDEVNTVTILAHTIGSAAKNADLYLSTIKQLRKLTVLYELSSAVTSVLNLEELLQRIAEKISMLLSSRGCIIRLLEDDRLKIKAEFGLPGGIHEEMELSVGEGIAGWVAETGEPVLAEDVSQMPLAMRVPLIAVKSVICVPLKVGAGVIGTLGLYDKFTPDGTLIPFTVDDLNTAEGFASISSIAIDKSKMYELEVRREKEASEDKKRMDILFDSVQGGIITLDRSFKIISANKYVEDWISITGSDLIGRNAFDIFHDKVGICPHCAAKTTFETGQINSIMQSKGVNYAELTAYPIREVGEIRECIVFIQDITERVLYQEETLSLYREVIQTKEYLESLIDNSADAIVTTDLEGIVTSWNLGAEKTFGFTEAEAVGKVVPFFPDFLLDREKEYAEKIKKGEVLKGIETLRRRKDGTIIEVSLTLSPIKDAAGEVIGMSGISRDISEKKSVEKELIRRNQELSRLFFISSAMRGTLELDKLLRMVLVAVTMSDGMGFNRAILFLVDEMRNTLKGAMGVGPESHEEAWRIWDELSFQKKTLEDIMQEVVSTPLKKDSFLDRLTMAIEISLEEDTVLTRAVKERKPFNVRNVREEPLSDTILIQQLGTQAYAIIPLISRDKVIGIIWVDNYFNRKEISDEDMKFLASFSNHVASAIENARLFEQVKMAEQQLENIFESMSDMVYFNNKDYVIQSVNKAVCNKLGLTPSEIIGKKCYEVFHGMNEPYKKCPHYKTVTTKKAYIEELEDRHLGGTFLTSSSPIFDLTGEFIGSVHVVRDITEIKNLQEKLVLAEKMAALGEVAAKVAHEIRNPLVSVGGFAKRLEKKLDGNLREYAGIIVKEVDRLEGILKEILGFVKEVRLAKETVNLNSLVADVVTVMESAMEDRGIMFVKDFGPPAEVFIDPNRVNEAIMNIIANAIQSLKGSGLIYIRTYTRGIYVVVEIRDTGRGIPESDRPFIFNPFFTTKESGTGLGLAITHRIIQEHNGMIEVESEIDEGSIFRVFIPIKEASDEDTDR